MGAFDVVGFWRGSIKVAENFPAQLGLEFFSGCKGGLSFEASTKHENNIFTAIQLHQAVFLQKCASPWHQVALNDSMII
jgi:hypothetical protein